MTMNSSSPAHAQQTQQIITLRDVAKRVPNVVRKLPHILDGLRQVYLRGEQTPTGLAHAFEAATAKHPDGYAVFFERQKFTYQQLNEWANQIAHYFLSIGAKKGDVVAVMLENRPELLATVLGLAKIGVISALLNTSQTKKVLTHSINLVKPIALICGAEVQAAIQEVRSDLEIDTGRLYWFADAPTRTESGKAPNGYNNLASMIAPFASFNPPTTAHVYGSDGLFYIYTSGTTGLPKAVVFSNGRWTLAYGTYGHILNLDQEDVLYSTLPLYHATGMVVCWTGVIAGQAAFAIRRKFSRSSFWDDVRFYDASAIGYVGELCRYLLDSEPSPADRQHRVRKMIGNGMRPNIWNEFKQRFGIDEVLELYASSEGNIGFSNIFNFDNTVGFSPMPYAIVRFDKEQNAPVRDEQGFCQKVRVGETGLLIGKITARTPFDGYTDPEKNRAVILENVFKPGDQYFNTGDLVRNIGFRHAQFVDRLGDTFRWKGENVSTTEVENLLCGHPHVIEAVVYGVEIPNTNGRAGMAAITLHTDAVLDETALQELLTHFREQLPAYAVPLFLRVLQQVETTETFKYPKNTLKEQHYNPELCQDQLYVWLPGEHRYQPLSPEMYQQIQQSQYRF